jgi:hypothetical protein
VLPHRAAAPAVEVLRRSTGALPAWPSLPRRDPSEQCRVYSAAGFPGLQFDRRAGQVIVRRGEALEGLSALYLAYLENSLEFAAMDLGKLAGLELLLRRSEALAGALALQGSMAGPISLALQLTDEQRRPLIYDDVLFDALVRFLRLRVAWHEARLARLAPATIMCLDEPFADVLGSPFSPIGWQTALALTDEVLASVAGCRALLLAGELPWEQVLASSVELLVVDLEQARGLAALALTLANFFERGGALAIGIVPNTSDDLAIAYVAGLLHQVEALIEQIAGSDLSREMVAQRMLVTVRGSLGALEVEEAEHALRLLSELSARLRERYGIEGL